MTTKVNPICTLTFSATLVCLLVSSSSASTAEQQADKAYFKAMDTNEDGRLSPEEHAAGAKRMFETMDANKDGMVTSKEMDASHEKVAGKQTTKRDISSVEKIKVIDINGDGVLSAEEHVIGSKKIFGRMDSNKDGFLSQAELEAGHATMLKKP